MAVNYDNTTAHNRLQAVIDRIGTGGEAPDRHSRNGNGPRRYSAREPGVFGSGVARNGACWRSDNRHERRRDRDGGRGANHDLGERRHYLRPHGRDLGREYHPRFRRYPGRAGGPDQLRLDNAPLMTQANASETPSSGGTIATHAPGDGKEYQVVLIAGSDGHIKGTKNTYSAVYKLADATTTGLALSIAFTANQYRQIATIFHPATATKRVTIKRVEFHFALTAATIINVELIRITSAPATGNPTITPVAHIADHPAAETTCLALPGTAGTYAANTPLFDQEFNLAAAAATNAPGLHQPIHIFPASGMPADDDLFEPVLRAGVAEGYAVALKSTAAVTIKGTARIIFTEE